MTLLSMNCQFLVSETLIGIKGRPYPHPVLYTPFFMHFFI